MKGLISYSRDKNIQTIKDWNLDRTGIRKMGYTTLSVQKKTIETLAQTAFHQHLISGYGDSEYPDQYQITYKGKPRHLSLEQAQSFLKKLLLLAQLDQQFH